MEYNTSRAKLILPEYGRHIQRMVDHLAAIEDREKRQKNAELIIDLMGELNPHLQIVEDFRHILWNHLFVVANFDLDIDSPYPKPTREQNLSKPKPFPYPNSSRRLRHLGKNLSTIIDKAIVETDVEKKQGFINTIVYYMKLSYVNWHHEPPHDTAIAEELKEISNGQLIYEGGDIKVKVEGHANGAHRRYNKNFKNNNRPYNKGSKKTKRIK